MCLITRVYCKNGSTNKADFVTSEYLDSDMMQITECRAERNGNNNKNGFVYRTV